MFAGSNRGGDCAAAIYSLVVIAKQNDVAPRAWLAGVLRSIADHRAFPQDEDPEQHSVKQPRPNLRGRRTHFSEKVQSRMSEKETLQAFLSAQRLRELAGPKVYARGERYSVGGNVQLHEHTRGEAIGEVLGSQPYRVELKLTLKGLVAECTCPAMSDHGFCKHAVALGLHLLNAPPPVAQRTVKARKIVPDIFTEKYPNIAAWIKDGWIEIGRDGHSTSIIRVLDEGGLIWEGGTRHKSMDKILQEAEDAIAGWTSNR